MRRTEMFAAILVTMTVVACDAVTAPQPAEGPGLEPDGVLIPVEAVTASATGSAHRAHPVSGLPITLSFSAVERADGTVEGEYTYHAVGTGTRIRVNVTCMTVVDNRAWVAGIIVDGSPNVARLIGTVSYFYTTDNGEGAAADSDEVSLVRAGDRLSEAELFCTELPTQLGNREVLHGNVNVAG